VRRAARAPNTFKNSFGVNKRRREWQQAPKLDISSARQRHRLAAVSGIDLT
jgi:hypothetical protein